MIKFLVRKFVKDHENTGDPKVRARYMTLSGVLGICCNAFLFAVKLAVGLITASISITSDAFNNLSDMGTSVVSIVGARLSDKHPDKDHPFGHGRIEYIASLVMAMLIMVFGVELLKTSVEGIIDPKPVALCYLGKRIGSALLEATARDSLSDCFSTLAVIAGAILTMVFGGKAFAGTFWAKIPFDGIIGLLVSLLIIWNGFSMAKEVVGLLLGGPPDPELVKKIEELVLGGKDILGVHDLIVHDYGPGRIIASAHAEVPMEVPDVVAACGTSRRFLERRMRTLTGRTILETIHEKRLGAVVRRLRDTDEPAGLVSDKLGFSSPAALSALFHRRFGRSMRDFRADLRRLPLEDLV